MPKQISLRAYYKQLRAEKHPAAALIDRLSLLTNRKPATIRMWLSEGQQPDPQTQTLIADALGTPAEILFPPIKKRSKNRNNDNEHSA